MQLRDQQRLDKIALYCKEVGATVRRCEMSLDQFLADRDLQRSISFSIVQIGELVSGLSEEYRTATKESIQWSQIKAMRNIAVHDYGNIDLPIVWNSATTDIPELLRFCEKQLADEEQS